MELWRTGLMLLLAATLCDSLWVPGTQIIYQYYARLDANSVKPEASMSRWAMKGRLVVQVNEDSATVQLQNVTVSAFNGLYRHNTTTKDPPPVSSYNDPYQYNAFMNDNPPPEDIAHLLEPFILHLENGKVVNIAVKADEHMWAINMKRGLADILQLDPAVLHSPASVSSEDGHCGHCTVEYTVHNSTNGTVSVTKNMDYSKSSGSPKKTLTNTHKVICHATPPYNPLDILSLRFYKLEPTGPNGELIISSVVAEGGIYYHPFQAQTEGLTIWTWVELHIETLGAIEENISVKDGGEKVGLKYEMPGADVSQGRSPPSQKQLISAVTKMLQELGESLEPPGLETNLTKLHEERVAHILYFLSLLDHASFSQLYSDLAVGTSYQHETFRNLFMEVLRLVGSHDSVLLIRDLVMGGTLKNDTAMKLLTALPFTVRNPTEQLLKDFEVILTLPEDSVLYNSAILTFSTLVHKVHISVGRHDIADKYLGQYFDLFTNSDSYDKQMLYLQALGNFELNRIAEYFAPIIEGTDSRYSNHIRYLASWITSSYYIGADPKEAHKLYWPIFSNYDEPLELRVAALTILLISSPTPSRFYHLAISMLEDPSVHLRHYWYTTLLSITQSKNPCYLHVVDLAKKAIMHFPEPSVRHWATGSYMIDHADPKYGFGSHMLLNMVANPHTGLPSTVYLEFANYAMQYSYNQYSLYVRLDGVGDLMKHTFMRKTELSIEKLVDLLQQLKLPRKEVEPIHIELILKVQNKAVLVHHANETSFSSLFRVLNNVKLLASGGVHVNSQNIMVPFLLEEMRMTDLGTPALLRITNSWMTSVRANLTTGKQLLSQLELRSFVSSQTAITQYNPILDMWHGVQRSLNLQTIVPFDLQLSVPPAKAHIKFSMQQTPGEETGVVGHVRTAVFVRGINAAAKLKEHCPTCPSQLVVTKNKNHPAQEEILEVDMLGMQFRLALLECEHSFYKEDLLEQLKHITEHQSINGFPAANSIISLLQLYDYLTLVPPSGSCGILAKLSPQVEDTIQVEVEIIVNTTMESETTSLEPTPSRDLNMQIIVTINSSSRWEINTQYVHSGPLSKHQLLTNFSSDNGHIASLNLTATFPEPSVEVTFLSGVEPQSALVEINAEWDTSSLQIVMEGEVMTEQQEKVTDTTLWPFNVCKHDLHDIAQWGHKYAPLTEACFNVARELATLRKYNFSISSKDLPSWMDSFSLNNINLELEVPRDSQAVVTLNGRKKMLSSSQSMKLQPWLINTQFPPLMQHIVYFGILGTCVTTSKSVWTMDGNSLKVDVGQCYSLSLADCSETPQFAVFIKKLEGTIYPLALKIYSGNNYIELLPNAKNLSITVDNDEVKNLHQGYKHHAGGDMYQFKIWQRSDGLIRIYLSHSHLYIEYYGHLATMTVLGVYHGKLCGVCGNHNGDASDDTSHLYSLSCST